MMADIIFRKNNFFKILDQVGTNFRQVLCQNPFAYDFSHPFPTSI